MTRETILESLDLVAARLGDATPAVYRRLFAERPEMEPLFALDQQGLVRGQMLSVAIEALLDYTEDNVYAANLIRIERINHEGKGIPPGTFDLFYRVMLDTFRAELGTEWTREIDMAWTDLLARFTAE
jgi:hemoglobin-like flavoprotein